MLRRLLAVASVAMAALLGLAGTASADPTYPPVSQGSAGVSDSQVAPGQSVTFTATGFRANSPVTMTVTQINSGGGGDVVATESLTANDQGTVTTSYKFTAKGTYKYDKFYYVLSQKA